MRICVCVFRGERSLLPCGAYEDSVSRYHGYTVQVCRDIAVYGNDAIGQCRDVIRR